ncbi:hypothetical protein D9757_010887 [Collybiopsis confluens]|uniref:Uncharacterized protein n=1 Tax=Collybiopsis confluens TaxID=2823264 RepID=A0A8H5H833_9AGAR|nr:hypothetical protein D9757_010887 [Collybiopsis confluens]
MTPAGSSNGNDIVYSLVRVGRGRGGSGEMMVMQDSGKKELVAEVDFKLQDNDGYEAEGMKEDMISLESMSDSDSVSMSIDSSETGGAARI